jgi:hypothetical protein
MDDSKGIREAARHLPAICPGCVTAFIIHKQAIRRGKD